MRLLLCTNVEELGIVGDIVEVSAGYARNFLLPKRLATEPTQANMRALAEARKAAELERSRQRKELEALAERIKDVEVTIRAKANEEGVLYGSVGTREIADALAEEEYFLKPEQIMLDHPLRQLDNVSVEVRFADDLRSTVKVWVVREKSEDDASPEDSDESQVGREAGSDDNSISE